MKIHQVACDFCGHTVDIQDSKFLTVLGSEGNTEDFCGELCLAAHYEDRKISIEHAAERRNAE